MQALDAAAPFTAEFHEGQILDTRTGREVRFEDLLTSLLTQDIIYLGEEHHNRHHVAAAVQLLDALRAKGRLPTVAMEMFTWEAQEALDQYMKDPSLSRIQFMTATAWDRTWGGAFDNYEPLVNFSRTAHLPLIGLNPPKGLVRSVAFHGLREALRNPEMARWQMLNQAFIGDTAYRARITEQIRECHGKMSDAQHEHMYEASLFRDEGMAKRLADLLTAATAPAGPIVSYTGGGHIQYGLPVPNRVHRRRGKTVRQQSIYLLSYEQSRESDLAELTKDRIADYIWLTPVGDNGPPRRCR